MEGRAMPEEVTERRVGRGLLAVAAIIALAGGALLCAWAVWWFGGVSGHCGVVRFYEQALGVVLTGGWLAGTAIGLAIAYRGRRNARSVRIGSATVIATTIIVLAVCTKILLDVRANDYTLKNTDQLMGLLGAGEADAQVLSAHALGERRAIDAIPPLCAILDDAAADINLRHNAAIALGRICSPPRPEEPGLHEAVTTLVNALRDRDEYLPSTIAEALGRIGDPRGIGPLADLLADESRPRHVRLECARALSLIGGEDAHRALARIRSGCTDPEVAAAVDRMLRAPR